MSKSGSSTHTGWPRRNGTSTSRRLNTGAGGDAAGDPLLHPLERVAAGNGRRVEDQGHGHVHVEARGLEIEEAGIESAESFHRRSFPGRRLALQPGPPHLGPGVASLLGAGPCLMEGWPGCSSQSALPSRSSWSTPTYPVRREPFTVVSFALGWIPGELPAAGGRRRGRRGPAVLVLERRPPRLAGLGGAWPSPSARWPGWSGWPWSPTGRGALVEQALDERHRRRVDRRRGLRPGPDVEPLVAAGHRRALPVAGHQEGQEHRLLGRRELPAQARHPDPPVGRSPSGRRSSSTSTAGPGSSGTSGSRASR